MRLTSSADVTTKRSLPSDGPDGVDCVDANTEVSLQDGLVRVVAEDSMDQECTQPMWDDTEDQDGRGDDDDGSLAIGGEVWPAAAAMCDFLANHSADIFGVINEVRTVGEAQLLQPAVASIRHVQRLAVGSGDSEGEADASAEATAPGSERAAASAARVALASAGVM